jgi:hypothetical protein
MKSAIAVANWLRSREEVTAATPVVVQIGRRAYPAARYTEDHDGVETIRLYVVGELPPLQGKMRWVCYRTDDSEYAWHVVAWFRQRSGCTEWSEVTFGKSHFILALWSPLENWATDQAERKPYRRVPMTITPCGPAPTITQSTEENRNGDHNDNGGVG